MGGGVLVARLIGELVTVGLADTVLVTSKACAICVWFMDATNVFTASVMITLASSVGTSVACHPHADKATQTTRISTPIRFLMNIVSFREVLPYALTSLWEAEQN